MSATGASNQASHHALSKDLDILPVSKTSGIGAVVGVAPLGGEPCRDGPSPADEPSQGLLVGGLRRTNPTATGGNASLLTAD